MIRRFSLFLYFFITILMSHVRAGNVCDVSLPWLESGYNVSFPEGMSSRTNYKVIKDRDGFLWFSTSNGMECYDGLTFLHYHLGKSQLRSIEDGFMVNVVIDQTQTIWTYTERNIVTRFNPQANRFDVVDFLSGRSEGNICCLHSDGETLLVGFSKGVVAFDLKTSEEIGKYCEDQEIRCIEPMDKSHVFVGTRQGLWLIDMEQKSSLFLSAGGMDVNCLRYDAVHDLLWIGSRGMGLHYAQISDLQTCKPIVEDDFSIINVIRSLNDSVMLVGTDGQGLKACMVEADSEGRFVPSRQILVASESASAPCQLPNSVIDDILVDGDNLWLTLDLFGVALLQPRNDVPCMVNPLSVANADRNALDVSVDRDGRYWIAFPRCIACYDTPESDPKIYMDEVSGFLTVCAASDGTVWCGGYNAGTYHFDPRSGQTEFFPSVVDNKVLDCVYAFAEDDRHDIWVGGLNFGLTRMHKTESGEYEKMTIPEVNLVTDIRVFSSDTLFVGSFDGVWIVNTCDGSAERVCCSEDTWTYTSSIGSLVVAPNREVWLGTMGAGLACYDIETHQATLYGTEYSLPSLEIRGVEMLNDSVLCASTEKDGIFAFDIRNHCVVRSLRHSNGQPMGIFSRSSSGGRIHDHVAFGSDNGVISVGNADISAQRDTFQIFASGENLRGNSVHLPYSSRNLYLQFTTNDLYHQSEYRFEYLIPGLTHDWESLDETRRFRYLSLPPGHYDILVRSYNATSLMGELQLSVEVEQIFWMRWYCLLTYALLFVALVWFVVNHYRIKHISETDGLTGIFNRYAGQKYTAEQLLIRTRGVFFLLDCDKFKHVNDNFGHLVGDKLLIRVARALKSTFPDDITMRLGGDEFAVFVADYGKSYALDAKLEQLMREIQSIRISEMPGYVPSISIGVAIYDGNSATTFEQLYTQADQSLYESKKHEGCWVTFG